MQFWTPPSTAPWVAQRILLVLILSLVPSKVGKSSRFSHRFRTSPRRGPQSKLSFTVTRVLSSPNKADSTVLRS
jgi:hypothetical protein